jgi:pseudaminic acid synthase
MALEIGGVKIGKGYPPFIIAEMSGNHNQSLERAMKIVDAAAESGANALKLQTYTADTITLDIDKGEFFINDKDSLWKGKSLYDLYKQAYTPWDWHKPIMQRANELGMVCFSSPFDESAVDFLEEINVPAYKIASFENNHLPLIRKAASTGKPIIISTGMASQAEIYEAVSSARQAGCKNLILLKCTSTYPASSKNSNILTIPHMQKTFECEVGLSDHTKGIGSSISAVAHGASVIEKHFTLSRDDGGVDSIFSLEPEEFKALVEETSHAFQSLGSVKYGVQEQEKKSLLFRRSLYVVENMSAGEQLTIKNMRCIRPGLGLSPKYFDLFLGKKVTQDVKRGTPVSWDIV